MLSNIHIVILIFSNIIFPFAAHLFLSINNAETGLFGIACGDEVHAELQREDIHSL